MKKGKISVEQIFKNAWELFKNNIGALLLVVIVGIALVAVFIVPGSLALVLALGGFAAKGIVINPFTMLGIVIFAVLTLFGIAVSLVYSAALIKAIGLADDGKKINFKEVFAFGYRKLWPLVLVGFLAGLFVFIGFIFLIIPGIIVAVYLQFAIYAVVFEEKRGMEAIRRSCELVKGKFWWVVLVVLVVVVLQGVLGSIPFVGSVAAFILAPFWQCVTYFLYKELKTFERKDG